MYIANYLSIDLRQLIYRDFYYKVGKYMSKSTIRGTSATAIAEKLEEFERVAKEARNELREDAEAVYAVACELTNNVMRFEARLSAAVKVLRAASESTRVFAEYADKLDEYGYKIFKKASDIEANASLPRDIANIILPNLTKLSYQIRKDLDKIADGKSSGSKAVGIFLDNGMYIRAAVDHFGLKNFPEYIDQKVDDLIKEIDEVLPIIREAHETAKATGWPKVAGFLRVTEELLADHKRNIELTISSLRQMSRELNTTKIVKLKEMFDDMFNDLRQFRD